MHILQTHLNFSIRQERILLKIRLSNKNYQGSRKLQAEEIASLHL